MSTVYCPSCGQSCSHRGLGQHFARGCGYPEFSNRQRETIRGLLLAGAHVQHGGGHPLISIESANKKLLQTLDAELGWMSMGVQLKYLREDRERATTDMYVLRTRRHPDVDHLDSPHLTDLTPEQVKVWYALRGSVDWSNRFAPTIAIALGSRSDLADDLVEAFADVVLDDIYLNAHVRSKSGRPTHLSFRQFDTPRFLRWVGHPLDGARHLWEVSSRTRYEDLKRMELSPSSLY